jgi:hypothetical protein
VLHKTAVTGEVYLFYGYRGNLKPVAHEGVSVSGTGSVYL